ncbi:MAG: hypothetical protein HHJ15_00175 [Rhodoferax sp.]|uniref:hypothetical protein n=1 Tax=Rhodoferax sp. TaxID=50421 RepID=UPI0017C06F13|nr:hypothetical protein [Rhodoferax sp.]NMM18371.1 hypothetical protein [Rhodoferax sp.]
MIYVYPLRFFKVPPSMPRIPENPLAELLRITSVFGMAAGIFLATATVGAQVLPVDSYQASSKTLSESGIVFRCTSQQLLELQPVVDAYLESLGVDLTLMSKQTGVQPDTLAYTLIGPSSISNTLDLIDHASSGLTDELVELPAARGEKTTVLTVSKKEIVYAMLQHGRTTLFIGPACDVQALKDHVGVRQNIVAWTESLAWKWPNGGSARWNKKYWKQGTPVKGPFLHEAVNDVFLNQEQYAMGCFAAIKLVMIQGILDYYRRIKKDPVTSTLIEARLLQGGEPLDDIEPGVMWNFEVNSTPQERARPGKLLGIQYGVPADNFIPGDWAYFLNTDPVTYGKIGYEGSNAVYLGRGKFNDFYNDHHHYYTYKEKLNEVYQWRNKVFSRRRDVARVKPLSAADFERLSKTPERGGIQLDLRGIPFMFGYQNLPQ